MNIKHHGLLAILVILWMTGCSSKFAYNNIDWMLYWYVDDYIELDKRQKSLLDAKIEKWHRWHRQTELVEYRQQLLELRSKLQSGPMTEQNWLDELNRGNQHWHRFRERVGPELLELAKELSDQQITDLFDYLEKDNLDEIEERNEDTPQQRWVETKQKTREQIKDYFGKLSQQQKDLIDNHVERFQTTFDYWIASRRKAQSYAKQLLLERHDNPDYAQQLYQVMENPDQFRSAEYIQASEQNRLVFAQLLAELNQTLSPKQLKHAVNEIDDLVDDLTDLIND
ncbi:DUF6279 family lipoprotein [Aliiglaciecola sp. LCG003]|uniref:DUF6279 family lipoprotein n=1 Tax=Aliiglaciecola sp. LCG003 TaxID=3053655 RepID=UPI00257222A8|nr:DUF6279 family lipoprotein [Aliiglaciecola sp. LCG003]WJG10995.1 DUF6279 family lipoprotein [Aliiglaciecola sp. LCG003]